MALFKKVNRDKRRDAMHKTCFSMTFTLLLAITISITSHAAPLKPRVVVLTDISTWETDDHESLIRFLAHADMFEIEGLVISTGYSIKTLTKSPEKDFITIAHGVINAYEKDLHNLMKRSGQVGHKFDGARQEIGYWPSPNYLRERTMFGSLNRGRKFIGAGNDSPGSGLIIKQADEEDPRPVWVTVWGGGNTVAQSIYRVKKDRTADQFKAFLRKIRVYTITDQDRHYRGEGHNVSAHGLMREQAGGDLLFIWDESAWKAHNGTGRSNWNQYAAHIQGHGNLGGQYPKYKYGVEGDTPSFLYLMPTGLNDPEDPTQCSWGGTFKGNAHNLWQPARSCGSYFGRFYPAAFNNFAARMDWAKSGAGNRNPVIVLDGDDGIGVLTKTPRQGTAVTLDASKTFDPDGDKLKFNWWIQSGAGTYSGNVDISTGSSNIAVVNVPPDSAGTSFHVICEVTDDGTHNLSDYRRIIFEPTGKVTVKPKHVAGNFRTMPEGRAKKGQDGGSRIAAGNFDSSGGSLDASGGKLYYIKPNAWTQYDSVNLHTGTTTIQMRVANGGGASAIEVRVDGKKVGVLTVDSTGGWNAYETRSLTLSSPQNGVHKVKLVFVNGNVNVDWFMFSASTPPARTRKPSSASEKPAATAQKPRATGRRLRVVMSTDFPPIGVVKGGNVPNTQKSDPDDMQSMVRFLLYANEFDIEGLIASAGTFANKADKQNILDVISRYEKVYGNLKKHDPLYPTPDYLRSVTFQGRSGTWGKKGTAAIGAGKDSEASDALIAIVDKPDPRPVYVGIWGDCSVIAQAVWKVQNTRSPAQLDIFLGRLRIHQIATQDGTIGWLRSNFPKLFIIHSHKTYQGMFGGRDPNSNLAWVNKNIRNNHGPLCAVYPHEGMGCTGVCEGDSPSFLWLVSANRGVNDPDDPTQPSWGGQFIKDGDKNHYVDGPGRRSISRWRKEYQKEFAERADWCVGH